jgi:tRNA nucleotidyltransferase (CCA-adding enzyme)
MYLDCSGKVLDFHNGLEDLENKIIRTVGNPLTRIKEDPTRILRAIRFMLKLNFELDKELEQVIKENINLIN